ncbi:MAG TPA: cytochrome b [Solimonas sp.]|nr:cytochrome b [Solimonas sp.]
MTWRNTTDRYGTLSVWMHWLMVLLLAAVYLCITLRTNFPRGSTERTALMNWHFMLGISVLVLVGLRMLARLTGPTPLITPAPAWWLGLMGRVMHLSLYVFMIGMPLLGWLMRSAQGRAIPFFGLQLPPLIGRNEELGDLIKLLHVTGGEIGYYLIGLHAAGGLFHHSFLKDNTLGRMLPVPK